LRAVLAHGSREARFERAAAGQNGASNRRSSGQTCDETLASTPQGAGRN
jgi:hypothetical protein